MTVLLMIAQELFQSIPDEDRNALASILNSVKRMPELASDLEAYQAKVTALTAVLERHVIETGLALEEHGDRLEKLECVVTEV